METADATATEDGSGDAPRIRALRHSDDRTVFTEEDNTDGWIATDHAVDVTR